MRVEDGQDDEERRATKMSSAIQCDTCGTAISTSAEALMDWMRVEWGVGRMNTSTSDFCSPACLAEGVEAEEASRELVRAQIEMEDAEASS